MKAWTTWGVKDFSEGMIDSMDAALLPVNAAQDCCNFVSRYIGIMEKRPGQARFNGTELPEAPHGMYSYYNGDIRKLLAMSGTKLFAWDPSTSTFDEIRASLDDEATMEFETCANYMVGMNGVDAPFKWSGAGSTSVLAQAPVGRYPTLFKEKLFCVPASDKSQLWWSDSLAPETWPAVNYWDIKKGDGDEITCLRGFYGDLVIFKNRSIHLLRGTSLDDFRLDEMDSRIGCVGNGAAAVYEGGLYFVCTEGVGVFNGLSAKIISDGKIPKLWRDIDKASIGKARISVWDNWIWAALPLKHKITMKVTSGCSADGNVIVTLGGESKAVALTTDSDTADKVASEITALKFGGWTVSVITDTVTFTRDELRQPLSLDLSGGNTGVTANIATVAQTTNNLVLMINPDGNKIFPAKGINASDFAIWNDGEEIKFLSGDATDGYVNQQDFGTEDFGNAVSAYWIGKAFDADVPECFKRFHRAYVVDYPNQIIPATLKASYDYGDFVELNCTAYDKLQQGYLVSPQHAATYWRYLTPRLSHASPGRCEVRGIKIPFVKVGPPRGRNSA